MKALAVAAAAVLAAAAVRARAEDPAPAPPGGTTSLRPSPAEGAEADRSRGRSDRWGLSIDAGFPEGASVGIAFRPVANVRFWAGPAWNYVAWGVQGGIAAVPWHFAVTPVLSAEVGHYFGSNVSFLAKNSEGVPEGLKPLLSDMGYSYLAAHVGLELGSQRRGISLSLRGGLSYISLATKGTATTTDAATGTTVTFTDPRVRGTIPSVKLGLQYWF